jgi:hypothetical protein
MTILVAWRWRPLPKGKASYRTGRRGGYHVDSSSLRLREWPWCEIRRSRGRGVTQIPILVVSFPAPNV